MDNSNAKENLQSEQDAEKNTAFLGGKNQGNGFSKFAKSTLQVFLSNGVLLLSSLLTGFFVPKLLGVEDYGYFKTFTLYSSYIQLFQFGLINGIFLKYGGKDFNELSESRFRLYSRILFLMQLFFSCIGVLISLSVFSGTNQVIGLLVSVYGLVANDLTYFQEISQITQRFKEYSVRLLVQSILKIVAVGLLWLVSFAKIGNLVSFSFYAACYTSIFVFILVWYLITYRKLVFGKADSFRTAKSDVFGLFKSGLPLMVADFVVTLVYACDRQVVSIFFDNASFSIFSFAYTIVTLITTLVSAISTVLYPTLKRMDEEHLISSFSKSISLMMIFGFASLVSYYPIVYVISAWLPEYSGAIEILRIILPGVIISSVINVIIQNYYKTLNKNGLYFWISLCMLFLAAGTDVGCFYLFHNTESIAAASVVVFFVWYLIGVVYFVKRYHAKIWKNFFFGLSSSLAFYVSVFFCSSDVLSFFLFLFLYFLLVLAFFPNTAIALGSKLGGRGTKANHLEASDDLRSRKPGPFSAVVNLFRTHKKKFLKNSVLVFVFFSFCFCASTFCFDNSNRAISETIIKDRNASDLDFSFGSVVRSSDQAAIPFSTFKVETKKAVSTDMKASSMCFFYSKADEGFAPLVLHPNNSSETISPPLISAYNETFLNNNYNFSLLFDQSFQKGDESKCLYVSQGLADQLIALDNSIAVGDYNALIGSSISADTSLTRGHSVSVLFKIGGILDGSSLGAFGTTFGTSFAFSNFNTTLYYCGGNNLGFFSYGGVIATENLISIFEGACKTNRGFSTAYYNYSIEEGFGFGNIQTCKENVKKFYGSGFPRFVLSGIFWFAAIFSLCFIYVEMRNLFYAMHSKGRDVGFLLIISVLLSFVFSYLFFSVLNGINLGGVVIVFLGNFGVTICFCFLLLMLFSLSLAIKDSPVEASRASKGGQAK